jgi:hypothetical protein
MRNSNFIRYVLLASAALFLVSQPVYAAGGSTNVGAGTATANLITPITIASPSPDLSFGTFAAINSGNQVAVTVPISGAASYTNATSVGGTVSAASFTVSGQANSSYTVSGAAGGTSSPTGATLGSFTFKSGNGTLNGVQGSGGLLGSSGSDNLLMGATVSILSGSAGNYSIPYSFSVNY